jgi:hypothetical protein
MSAVRVAQLNRFRTATVRLVYLTQFERFDSC